MVKQSLIRILEQGYVVSRLKSSLYRSFKVVITNSWIVTVYPSTPLKLICSTCHGFLFLFRLPWIWLFMSNSAVFLEKQRTLTLPVHPAFSGVRVAHLRLLICMHYFGYFMFFVMCVYFQCWVFGLHSLDFR